MECVYKTIRVCTSSCYGLDRATRIVNHRRTMSILKYPAVYEYYYGGTFKKYRDKKKFEDILHGISEGVEQAGAVWVICFE